MVKSFFRVYACLLLKIDIFLQRAVSAFTHCTFIQYCNTGWVSILDFILDCNKFPGLTVNQGQQQHYFPLVDECKHSTSSVQNVAANNPDGHDLEYHQFDLHQDYDHGFYTGFNGTGYCEEDAIPHISSYLPSICPPPSAFLGPKCALWDCPRPAQGLDWCQDYCSSFHAALALNEGPPGMAPVLRPGGIGLKDNLLFAALSAKAQGKDVGIPECEGAATAKSPWNAPGTSDLLVSLLWWMC